MSDEHGLAVADAVAERLYDSGVCLVGDSDLEITSLTNVLMNDLTLVELVSLRLQLPAVPQTRRRRYRRVLGKRSYERDLKRLEYLDDDYEWCYLAPAFNRLQKKIRRLFKSGDIPFAREWQQADRRTDLKYLKGLVMHQAFTAQIVPAIRDHYRQLKPVRLLLKWIEATGHPGPSMVDVIHAGVAQDGGNLVCQTLLSNLPSTAGTALERRRDVCFSCPTWRCCQPLCDVPDRYSVMMTYRSTPLDVLLVSLYRGKSLDQCLTEDGLIAKFFVPYSLVVKGKKFMVDIGLLSVGSSIRPKNAGKYCPGRDLWQLFLSEGV